MNLKNHHLQFAKLQNCMFVIFCKQAAALRRRGKSYQIAVANSIKAQQSYLKAMQRYANISSM